LRKYIHKRNEFLFVVLVFFEIFLELSGLLELPHTTKKLHARHEKAPGWYNLAVIPEHIELP